MIGAAPMTAKEIAAKLGVADRTVQRDLADMGAVGTRAGKFVRWTPS